MAGALLLWLQRGLTFSVDETHWFTTAGTGSLKQLLTPDAGHLSLFIYALVRCSLMLFGARLFPFTVLEIISLAAVGFGLYVFARPRIGAVLAVVPALLPMYLGTAWPTLLTPMIAVQYAVALACGVWAFLALERERWVWDFAACVLLCVSLATFSIAFGFVAASAISVLSSPGRLRRAWVIVIPTVLYAAWWAWARQFGDQPINLGNLLWLPAYIVDSVAIVAAALTGHGLSYAPATSLHTSGFDLARLMTAIEVAVVIVCLVFVALKRLRRERRLQGGFWAVLAIPLVLWTSQDLVLGLYRTPNENRYFYGGSIVLIMVASELVRGIGFSRFATLGILGLGALCVLANVAPFRAGRAAQLAYTQEARADMTVIELAGRTGDASYSVSSEARTPQGRYLFLEVGRYLDAVERYGPVGFSLSELQRQPEAARQAADITLARDLRLHFSRTALRSASCRPAIREPGQQSLTIRLPAGGATLESATPREVKLGRFSASYPVALGAIPPHRRVRLTIPSDRDHTPWKLSAPNDRSAFAVCTA